MKVDSYEDWREDDDILLDVVFDIENDVLSERGLFLDTSAVRGVTGPVFLGEDNGTDMIDDPDEAFYTADIREYEEMERALYEEACDEDGIFDAQKYRNLYTQWVDSVVE